MSYSFRLWSHPEKLLKDHITNVFRNGQILSERINLEDYEQVLNLALLLHDVGKASTYFQKYIKAIYELNEGRIDRKQLERLKYELGKRKNHARFSAIWTFIAIKQQLQDEKKAILGFIAVLKHHGHLENLKKMLEFNQREFQVLLEVSESLNYEEYQHILASSGFSVTEFHHRNFKRTIEDFFQTRNYRRKWKDKIQKELNSESYYFASLIFSILLSADKGECIFDGVIYRREKSELPTEIVDHYKTRKFGPPTNELNRLRNRVYDSVDSSLQKLNSRDHFLSINVPTGIGKTLTVLNAVLKLKAERQDIDRIIYCLPFTSIIDQNANVIEDILEINGLKKDSENLLINHHLSEIKYKAAKEEINDNRAEYLVHQFEANINVTTFYQLLNGMFTEKNREIRKLNSFANSIIILDEVQNIPSKYWPLVKSVFQTLAEKLNIVFVLVTATLPMIFSEEKGEIKELVEEKENIFKSPFLDRIELDTTLLKNDIGKNDFINFLKTDISSNREKSFLIILNTVEASKTIYKILRNDTALDIKYLSTNITPKERLKRIDEIRESKEPQVVVSTQLVEAGVDIDLDVVYRDLAPLDSIFQSAGRCNRNSKNQKGRVKVFALLDEEKRYASYIYSGADLNLTRELLTRKEAYHESDFFDLAKSYYSKIVKDSDDSTFILEQIDSLNYKNAFDIDSDKRAFQLIEERPTYPAYVSLDQEAKELLVSYEKVIETEFDDSFRKKREVKNILKKMAAYMVSVPEKHAFEREDNSSFFYLISENQKDFIYDAETGIEYEGGIISI